MQRLLNTSCALIMFCASSAAQSAISIDFEQTGSNVVVRTHGTLDLTGSSKFTSNGASGSAFVGSGPRFFAFSTASGSNSDGYFGQFSGPDFGGTGGALIFSSLFNGDFFSFNFENLSGGRIFVPSGYMSSQILSATSTFANANLLDLGLTPGTRIYTLTSGDTVTIRVPGIPEPAAWALMISGFALAGMALRTRRTKISFA